MFVCLCVSTHTHTHDFIWPITAFDVAFTSISCWILNWNKDSHKIWCHWWRGLNLNLSYLNLKSHAAFLLSIFFFYCRYAWLPMFVQNLLMKFLHWSQPWRYDMSGFVIFLENYMLDRLLCQVFAYYSISSSMFDK